MAEKSPGRELAIETLIDMEENGAFYRASRVLEEAVPNAIASRPNLVTRSAVVEQAHALQKYEIDTVQKYNALFGLDKETSSSSSSTPNVATTTHAAAASFPLHVKRVLEHSGKLEKSFKAAPPQLISALRNVCPSDSIRPLLRAIMTHEAMMPDEHADYRSGSTGSSHKDGGGGDTTEHPVHIPEEKEKLSSHLETYIANVCRMASSLSSTTTSSSKSSHAASSSSLGKRDDDHDEDAAVLHGLLISCLSILTGSILSTEEDEGSSGNGNSGGGKGSLKKTEVSANSARGAAGDNYLDPVMPSLQVGSVLSLLKYKSNTSVSADGSFPLDEGILDYLGKAASVYQERIEVKRNRMKKETATSKQETAEDRALSPIPIAPLTPTDNEDTGQQEDREEQGSESPSVEYDEEADGASDSESTDDSVERYNPNVVEGLVPHGMVLVDDEDDDDDDDDDNDDDDDDDMHRDDSSSSSSGSEGDPQHVELVDDQDDRDEEDEDDEDDNDSEDDEEFEEESDVEEDEMLREALALSLVDQGPAFEQAPSNNNDEQQETAQERAEGASSPPQDSSKSDIVSSLEQDESSLPPLPIPPPHYPYATLVDSLGDIDMDRNEAKTTFSEREVSEYLDPAEFSKFGSVPSSHALVHLLGYTIHVIRQRRREKSENDAIRSVPGGMGSSLFEPADLQFTSDTRNEDGENAETLQLLISTFLVFDQNRTQAIDNLRHAISTEQRNLQGEDDSEDEEHSPLAAEDDPALALAMNYVEDDVYLEEDVPPDTAQSNTSESLENKGMRRKAAAAAHDAAARLKSLRKQTEVWRNRVKLLSLCTLMSMTCLREYLRSTVSLSLQWSSLRTKRVASDFACVLDLAKLMPSTMVARLSESLSSLMSIECFRSYESLLSGDEGTEMENVFFPLQLYREALFCWGDCIPVLHPSDKARSDLLRSTMDEFISIAGPGVAGNTLAADPETLDVLPSSDSEVQLHKLVMLTRRFRVSDLLDGIVDRPIHYFTEDSNTKSDLFGDVDGASSEPQQFSKLIKLVGSAAALCPERSRRDLEWLYLALCHRCNVQVLLWDSLSVSSKVEADGIIASSTSAGSAADIIRVNPNPSSNLQFDTSKCSDSIAILSSHADSRSSTGGSSAHQRASKVWGTVVSSSFFSPKTGVHRWAVRLDKCERGHVFVGVATSQASTRTYVGGDKFGWGVIGTQALWHDRRKIRGDYGATFRTGSTIVVSLDTDAGTLSFSSWKDSSNSSGSFSLDPSLQTIASPSRRTAGGGTIDDWGVAFEGLPLDSRLYPAIGMYQRDDRVTLLNVESGGRSSGPDGAIASVLAGGSCYYPKMSESMVDSKTDNRRVAQVRRHNDVLSWDGILHVAEHLRSLSDQVGSPSGHSNGLLCSVLPSICASLSLLPSSVPMISQRFGVMILPRLARCIKELHSVTKASRSLFSNGLRQGKWVIRATGSADTSKVAECEEYVVEFEKSKGKGQLPYGVHGSGIGTTGKSKNGLVSIIGTLSGSALHFVEEWTDGKEEDARLSDSSTSSCVVMARTSLDGTRFDGTYANVQYGTTGQISGMLIVPKVLEDDASTGLADIALQCEALLCLAQGHLASVLAEDIAGDHTCEAGSFKPAQVTAEQWKKHCSALKDWISRPLLANGLTDHDGKVLSQSIDELRRLYASPLSADTSIPGDGQGILGSGIGRVQSLSTDHFPNLALYIDKIEDSCRIDGKGSFASLCSREYSGARRKVLRALVRHGGLSESDLISTYQSDRAESISDDVLTVWRGSLKVLEDGIRKALSSASDGSKTRKEIAIGACRDINCVSDFLLNVRVDDDSSALSDRVNEVVSFYATVTREDDLYYVQSEMQCSTKRALLRMSALEQIAIVLNNLEGTQESSEDAVAAECVVSMLPRLMGRNWAKAERRDREDLGGYYLAMLSGSVRLPIESLRAAVFNVYGALGRLLHRHMNDRTRKDSLSRSFVLSMLSAYIVTIRDIDISAVISDSSLFELLSAVIGENRDAVHNSREELIASDDEDAAIQAIHRVVTRDSSRSVVGAAISIIHVLVFQLSQFARGGLKTNLTETSLKDCLKLIYDEFSASIPLTESTRQLVVRERSEVLASEDWERWCGACLTGGHRTLTKSDDEALTRNDYEAGIAYLNEFGVGSMSNGRQKPSSGISNLDTAETSTEISESLGVSSFSCHQYLSQWLDILSCLTKSPTTLRMMSADHKWTDELLSAAGLSCNRDKNGVVTSAFPKVPSGCSPIPARYRTRVFRLMRSLMVMLNPSETLIEGLLILGGKSTTVVGGSDWLVCREIVSLLRHLHMPSFPNWRGCLSGVISRHFNSQDSRDVSNYLAAGIHLFLGGSSNTLGRGAYVLLKPPAATRLSADAQAIASSKSHGSSGSSGLSSGVGVSPHHLAGNGTEGIVAGLCRSDAAAGIVSSVLVKNGACEVILMNRQGFPSSGVVTTATSKEIGTRSSRNFIAVRALRTPLIDVALAEELPLVLDQSIDVEGLFGRALFSSVRQLRNLSCIASSEDSGECDVTTEFEKRRQALADGSGGCHEFTAALAALRSAIVVSSSKELVQGFLKTEASCDVFARVLSLACHDDGNCRQMEEQVTGCFESESLSELPKHEAQYSHLRAMLREITARQQVLDAIPTSLWESKLAEQRDAREASVASEENTDDIEESVGTRASSVNVGTDSDARPSSTRAVARSLVEDEPRRSESTRMISQSTVSSNNSTDDDEDGEAAATAAAHLREAAIAQMAELGLPRSWSELALRRTGGTNIEAAVHFCLERGGDMERLIVEEQERELLMQRQPGSAPSRRRSARGDNQNHLLRQLLEMGFPRRWCAEALVATGNNVDEALTWILTNGERLSAEDLGMEEEMDDGEDIDEDEDSADEDDEERHSASETRPAGGDEEQAAFSSLGQDLVEEATSRLPTSAEAGADSLTKADSCSWSGPVCPLRFISGRSIIDAKNLAISGLPAGGFSSVGTRGILLTSGKWYYEAVLETAGCLQIGWADGSFSGHCNADRGDGCGDGPSSWAFDGWRRYRWHASATEWGCRWNEGDIVGCMVDLDERTVTFTLNGQAEVIGMGVAFSGQGFRPCGGVYACVSFNRSEKLRLILGGEYSEAFKYQPPPGYKGVGEAVVNAVEELDSLLAKENILQPTSDTSADGGSTKSKRILCDFSDGEHGHELFAWQHRYYGSDASVHLGSAKHSKQPSDSPKTGSGLSFSAERSAFSSVSLHVEEVWKEQEKVNDKDLKDDGSGSGDQSRFVARLKEGYAKVAEKLESELRSESVAIGMLYCRKLVLHIMVTLGKEFDLRYFFPNDAENTARGELMTARHVWSVLDTSVSLRSAGWVGEAGAMAVAAEALGLGISSAQSRHISSGSRGGVRSMGESDDSLHLPSTGITQVLSSVLLVPGAKATSSSLAACAEAAIVSGGSLVFLQPSLLSTVSKSELFQDLLVAVVRRAVRLLAVVDYSGEDSSRAEDSENIDMDISSSTRDGLPRSRGADSGDGHYSCEQPDTRLTLFVTGLLVSCASKLVPERESYIMTSLVEAWSLGLLSSSMPWRMVCALSAAGILNSYPEALPQVISSVPTVYRFYSRLHSTVARRIWAERAAVPVCSRYVEALTDLLASVRRAVEHTKSPQFRNPLCVDAATPISFNGLTRLREKPSAEASSPANSSWEWDDGWLASDAGWEIWTGSVKCMAVDWKAPSRSVVRTLMDGGEGPPMLRPGCKVMRGLDWDDDGSGSINGNEDGKDVYETEKVNREKEKQTLAEQETESQPQGVSTPSDSTRNDADAVGDVDPTSEGPYEDSPRPPSPERDTARTDAATIQPPSGEQKHKRRKLPNPKLPVGTVLSIEPWNGIPAMARRVKWDLTGIEGVYRFGGDGGRFDISHVEVNKKSTRVRKRHPFPESAEQCAFRHGFGVERTHSVLLRLRRKGEKKLVDGEIEFHHQGILEWPDFGAAIRVFCVLHSDGAVTVTENDLLYGSKDAGWEARFGQPSYVAGTVIVLSPARSLENQSELDASSSFLSLYEELLGSSSIAVDALRDRATGDKVRVTSEMRLLRSKRDIGEYAGLPLSAIQAPVPPPMHFDSKLHASSISLSKDCRTITCVAPDGRGTAFASMGFTKGVHYWEVKLEQADIGSIFVGVAEKPTPGGSGGSPFGQESQPRLNRWHGWGFVNFRATYTAGAERVYGAHCHAGDTVGVLLDCDAGRVSFFFDGLKYGEHILNDLGCAFENLSPFGFNADGCGGGGAGQGATSGVDGGRGGRYPAHGYVRPQAFWPVVGLRNPGDRVTISTKWMSSPGIDGPLALKNILAVDELLAAYGNMISTPTQHGSLDMLPSWFVVEAHSEYERWRSGRWLHSITRGSGPHRMASFGLSVDLDTSPLACASACACLGLKQVLLPHDRVAVKRSAGRMLELPEEAIILGAYQGRLFYRLVSQKSEGGSLTEGGGRAWFWDESEVVDDGIELIGDRKGAGIPLPMLDRFTCLSAGGLKIVYEGGAVVRSDLEIFDGSVNIGSIPFDTVIPQKDVLERRVNSCGVVRYRIRYEEISNGWISAWIRGGKEEAIVQPVLEVADGVELASESRMSYSTPLQCAKVWYMEYAKKHTVMDTLDELAIKDVDEFRTLMSQGTIPGLSPVDSDMLLVSVVGAVADFSASGDAVDCSFTDVAGPMELAVSSSRGISSFQSTTSSSASPGANQAALTMLSNLNVELPTLKALLARTAMLRALNRRARASLPWLPVRPSQEGNAIFGGVSGQGASIDRVGRYMMSESTDEWVQVPSIASRLRDFRGLFFTCIKRSFLEGVMECTTTPTPLSHDEYELPREIRTVRINRLKARRALAGPDTRTKRKHSAFSQLQSETRSWGGAALRRGFVAKGHGGQKRAFKIKLIGEGVNDYSGPYREAFTDAMNEVTEVDEDGRGVLGVLDATPNNASQIGENRELYMFSTGDHDLIDINSRDMMISDDEARIRHRYTSLTMARDEVSREVEDSLVFLGRLVGTACRHGIPVDLPLPMHSVWKAMAEESTSTQSDCLREVDLLASRQFVEADNCVKQPMILQWQRRMLNSFMDGLSNVFPNEILTLMTGEEIRDVFCGNADIDVDLLRRVVEYEGYDEDDDVIQYFWEALREMDSNERRKFLQFVWARNRLPTKESAFDAPFKIQKDTACSGEDADAALPSASTCFFSLTLPEYTSKETLKHKLLFAIENVVTMESDYVTNDAEVGEGWRGV